MNAVTNLSYLIIMLVSVLTLAGCGRDAQSPGVLIPRDSSLSFAIQPTFRSIFTHIISPKCLKCHSGNEPDGDLTLESFQAIMGTAPAVIVPGNPDRSVFYTQIESGKMPKKAAKLSAAEISAVREWIRLGAKNNR